MTRCFWCGLSQLPHLMYTQWGKWFCKAVIECKQRREGHQ